MALKAKILLYDIETTPLKTYSWTRWDEGVIKVIEDSYMLCFSYMWLGEKKPRVLGLPDFADYNPKRKDDKKLVMELHRIFSEADIIVGHNSNSFDNKISQGRMLIHGLTPPEPYKQIDTKLLAKRYFRFNSNKLDELGKFLGIGQKLDTGGFALWEGCMAGDMKSWAKMMRYNKQDVALLEQVYLKMRPWMDNHPSISMYNREFDKCPKCGEGPLHAKGTQVSKTNRYKRFQCQACGGYCRSRIAEKSSDKIEFVN